MITLNEQTLLRYKQFTDWTDTLHHINEHIWSHPIAEGKASVAEIISHLINWDKYLLFTVIPAIRNGEGMVFPDFDPFNKIAYKYANSGVSQEQLLDEFKQSRHQLVEALLADPDMTAKQVTANGAATCPYTGIPYSLLYVIHEFNDHDNHHKKQIEAVL
ncbi:hypothetical protein AZ66_10865 [Paenibacillus sp. E194]|uniref:DinB family protein n=1 Tax=Paenibacillus sp. E194 TaxID=1458845 RepID=UPI0005CACB6B|nr:DinB family protein [Paenibacillus sp. E194]KJB87837.1 hypothetical protein AZ66_10865 [Paenibacillus sp. E194]